MRKNVIGILVLVMSLGIATPAMAEKDTNRVTAWNKVTDFFATVGRGKSTQKGIKQERRQNRRDIRMFKKRRKQRKKTLKRMENQKAKILEGVKIRRVPHGRGGIDIPK